MRRHRLSSSLFHAQLGPRTALLASMIIQTKLLVLHHRSFQTAEFDGVLNTARPLRSLCAPRPLHSGLLVKAGGLFGWCRLPRDVGGVIWKQNDPTRSRAGGVPGLVAQPAGQRT